MPGIKRKSTGKDGRGSSGGEGQSVISKFFKTTSTTTTKVKNEDNNNNVGTSSPRRKKKISVIHILDDDVTSSPSSQEKLKKIPPDIIPLNDDQGHCCGSNNNKTTSDKRTVNKNDNDNDKVVTISQQTLDKLARFSKDFKEVTPTLVVLDKANILTSKDCLEEVAASKVKKCIPSKTPNTPKQAPPSNTPQQRKFPSSNTPQQKKSPPSYTPLEKQVIKLRKQSHGALLFVECGYKYRFFGNDAKIAAKELNIQCHMDHNFMTASIPVHRINVHLERLIEKGYKVGVVKQTETAALKANSDNKNAPFTRSIANIYTKATYIDCQEGNQSNEDASYILSVNTSNKNDVINFVAVNPTTSDVIVHQCDSSDVSVTMETVLTCLKPCELILPNDGNKFVEGIISSYVKNKTCEVRVERLRELSSFGSVEINMLKSLDSEFDVESLLSCIRQLASYLVQFNIERILCSNKNFRSFHAPAQSLNLDGITIRNLEIFTNNTDGGVRGSLFSVLDHTCTPFGRRLLRRWISNPLVCKVKIERRLDAVTELVNAWKSDFVKTIRKGLAGCPDIENGLTIMVLRKATPSKLVNTVDQLDKLRKLFLKYRDEISLKHTSSLLGDIFEQVSNSLGDSGLKDALHRLNRTEAERDNKTSLFNASSSNKEAYPDIFRAKDEIATLESELESYRTTRLPKLLGRFTVEYKCVSGIEYLVEIKNKDLGLVPSDWIKITATKQLTRFRPPWVDATFKKLCRAREQLTHASNEAWTHFLSKFGQQHYDTCKYAVDHISAFDCLMSLAVVAKQPGYCRPDFTEDKECIEIRDGRHPVIEGLLTNGEQYVANDTSLDQQRKVMLISGPNMGGKSSYIKQIAINCLLAQCGSYIAASHATLSLLDGVYTRMGANDNITCGKSTFMVEMEEASRILRKATSKSLVILDELGRGTSTFDGMAIASATLKYFADECESFTLFVSHYPSIFKEYENHPVCSNNHMSFIAHASNHQEEHHKESIVFLYKVVKGIAASSYGLNVARLAGIDDFVIGSASHKSKEFADNVKATKLFCSLLKCSLTNDDASLTRFIEDFGN